VLVSISNMNLENLMLVDYILYFCVRVENSGMSFCDCGVV